MPTNKKNTAQPAALLLPLPHDGHADESLPDALLIPGTRSGTSGGAKLLPNVKVKRAWTLAAAARSGDAPSQDALPAGHALLALEAVDGTTIFTRADALAEHLARSRPDVVDANGALDLARFRDSRDVNRGALGWIWRRISHLELEEDDLVRSVLRELSEPLQAEGAAWVSVRAAKALMAAIEGQLAGPPGLYRWDGGLLKPDDRLSPDDSRLTSAAQAGPVLVFVHGTGSHTLGAFGDLPASRIWATLQQAYGGRIFGFEHRTFSESPIDNALALAAVLPEGTRLHLVTHSRGGLVGDLMSLDASADGLDELIDLYRRDPRPDELEREQERPELAREREQVAASEQATLRELRAVLRKKKLRVERYVRVAAPARGTALLSDNLDVFLSCLLSLIRKFGAWGIGAATSAVASPVLGAQAKSLAEGALKFLSRVVLEIADKRLDARQVPGIEAMLPEAPMGMLLGRAPVSNSVKMSVIAGDADGEGASIAQRIGVMFVDWAFFDRARNDLVVDTASMYGGLANRAADARAIFAQGPQVNHFRYFRDEVKSQNVAVPDALGTWLLHDSPEEQLPWEALAWPQVEAEARATSRGSALPADNTRPVVFVLPGIMGSHLAVAGKRIWLAPLSLARGQLSQIAANSGRQVTGDGLIAMSYERLASYLEDSHRVVRHDYDWRLPLKELGQRLATALRAALTTHPDQPVRILAHSMGGLVVRAAFASDKELWHDMVARAGSRLVMLGTPNHGSHAIVEALLGQANTVRMLARIDVCHPLQQVLDIIAGFPGVLHLLPAPGFEDAGQQPVPDYFLTQSWADLARVNNDLWFGRQLGGRPAQAQLQEARDFWQELASTGWLTHTTDRVAYIFGKADNTPCGLDLPANGKHGGNLRILGTPYGDGSVTWPSGRLSGLPEERYWHMPVPHGDLADTDIYFSDVQSLLEKGIPEKLGRLPRSRGEEQGAPLIRYRAGPPPAYPNDTELAGSLLHKRVNPLPERRKAVLKVSVRAIDLRFVHIPVMCGHYRGDPIAGAEAIIDRSLVGGALTHRQRLGIHASEVGSASLVLMPRSPEERLRQTGRGALVIGLGEMGSLSTDRVTQAVRAGVLRYLLQASERYGEGWNDAAEPDPKEVKPLRLASLLIGTNSSAQLEIRDAVKAIVLGVLLANRDFNREASGRHARITQLELVEVYRDTALAAAYAASDLEKTLASELMQLETRVESCSELLYGEGVRQRLNVGASSDYWPRLVVGDADRDGDACSDACYVPRILNPIPPDILRQSFRLYGKSDLNGTVTPRPLILDDQTPIRPVATRLRFTYMGEKARAEAIVQQRQPGLIEKLVDAALKGQNSTGYSKDTVFGNTVFQLLVPLAFKRFVHKARNLILVVDESTADLPWEMLEADGEPLVKSLRVVRQFTTTRFRQDVRRASVLSACIIANPDTQGYFSQFGTPGAKVPPNPDGTEAPDRLPSLEGAAQEGRAILAVMESAGYQCTWVPPDSLAGDVFTKLFAAPYRILAIAAHGIFDKRGADGLSRTGVVLSDGLVLSAAEVGLMETVPDLVFLSCCHLGKVGASETEANRLAASLARELIDMGVRCVVAAGWEVRDDAAQTFAETFFARMVVNGDRFSEAIFTARQSVLQRYPDCNTWGAYQAYGDPSYQLTLFPDEAPDNRPLLSVEELLGWIEQIRLSTRAPGSSKEAVSFRQISRRVGTRLHAVPAAWGDKAEVQHALGCLYSEFFPDGFEQAQAALIRAIAMDTSAGVVPISAIEQLINIEVRHAARLADSAQASDITVAIGVLDDAIKRLKALLSLGSLHPHLAGGDARPMYTNLERQSLLGSAYKRKAAVLLKQDNGWDKVKHALELASDAYRAGDGDDKMTGWNPYARINRLQIDVLLGKTVTDVTEVTRCQEVARDRFYRDFNFFDAVMSADAAVARWMMDGTLPEFPELASLKAAEALGRLYLYSVRDLRYTPRQFDSVTGQLKVLAAFLALRGGQKDAESAQVLYDVVATIGAARDKTP